MTYLRSRARGRASTLIKLSCAAIGAFALLCVACDGEDGPARVQGACEGTVDCAEGLICGQLAPVAGTCTTICTSFAQCRARHGASFGCVNGSCVQFCGAGSCTDVTAGTCPDSMQCTPYQGSSCATRASICTKR
jgi:hypothetical protein